MTIKLLLVIVVTLLALLVLKRQKFFYYKPYYNIGLILLTLCVPISIMTSYEDNVSHSYLYISSTVIIIAAIFIINISKSILEFSWEDIFFILLMADIVFMVFSVWILNHVNFINLSITYISIYFIYLIYKSFNKTYESYEQKIFNCFTYLAIFNGIFGIVQYITNKKLIYGRFNENIMYTEGLVKVKRAVGIAMTNNAGGNLSAILFTVVLYNYIVNRRKRDLAAVILTGVFSILTLTRIAYVAIFLSVIIYIFSYNWKSVRLTTKKLAAILSGVLVSAILLALSWHRIYEILFVNRGNTQGYRFIQYGNVTKYILPHVEAFKGIGLGQYRNYIYYYYKVSDIDLHTQYLNVLIEQGWLVFILFMIFNIYILIKALKASDSAVKKSFAVSLFVVNFICSNFNPNQYYYVNNILYYLLIFNFYMINNNSVKIFRRLKRDKV